MLNRVQRELRTIRSTSSALGRVWKRLAAALVRLDPSVVERLAAQMSGRDDVLAAMAVGVAKAGSSRKT